MHFNAFSLFLQRLYNHFHVFCCCLARFKIHVVHPSVKEKYKVHLNLCQAYIHSRVMSNGKKEHWWQAFLRLCILNLGVRSYEPPLFTSQPKAGCSRKGGLAKTRRKETSQRRHQREGEVRTGLCYISTGGSSSTPEAQRGPKPEVKVRWNSALAENGFWGPGSSAWAWHAG